MDPEVHGEFLEGLHQVTKLFQDSGRLLQQILSKELQPILEDLSNALLHPDNPRSELDDCIGQLDAVMQHLRSTRAMLREQLGRIEDRGENFPST